MPHCEGRPGAACPSKVNNSTVVLCQGDLMLCRDCKLFSRFPYLKTIGEKTTVPSNKPAAATPIMQSGTDQSTAEPKIVVNKLLFFLNNKFDCLARDTVHSTIADVFHEDAIMAAKQILVQHLDTCLSDMIQPLLKRRIGDNRADRTTDDVLNILVPHMK